VRDTEIDVTPFLKWAGGKRWLLSRLADIIPKTFNRYIEPFLGSAAAYFYLSPKQALLSDINSDLINCYVAIRDDWKRIQQLLDEHQKNHGTRYYYKIREKNFRGTFQRAAKFLYLNRTCWNGLYRVNLDGRFNVPIGTKDSVILETDDFKTTAKLLKSVEINCCDFEQTIDYAQSGDFVFVDPPYTVKHNHNGFIKYNERLFSWNDQIRLSEAVRRASMRGAKVLVTNANHRSVQELYSDFPRLTSVTRKSVLAADPNYRAKVQELLIQSWR